MYVCDFIDNLLFLGDNGLHTGPQSYYMRRPLSPMVWDKAGEKLLLMMLNTLLGQPRVIYYRVLTIKQLDGRD